VKNQLYYGDNLTVLREHIKDESVDLIYLDPPFNSRQDYNVLFAEKDGTRSSSQIMALEDTWEWNMDAEAAYQEIVERGGRVSVAMRAFSAFLGHSDTMAYLAMMAPRLIDLQGALQGNKLKAQGKVGTKDLNRPRGPAHPNKVASPKHPLHRFHRQEKTVRMIRQLQESILPVERIRHLILRIHDYCHGSDFSAVIEGLPEGTHQKEFPDTLTLKIQTSRQTPQQRCW
jgi:hypothetical protein